MSGNVKHSKKSVRWGTPDRKDDPRNNVITRERAVMGRIGFDPCSESVFNKVVQADKYLSLLERGEDGLKLPWEDFCHVNPPGGLVVEFWLKLIAEIKAGRVKQAMWVGFSVEQLNLLAAEEFHPTDFQICYARKRFAFDPHDRDENTVDRPSHGNFVVGLGTDWNLFEKHFGGDFGKVQKGPLG